MLIVSDRQPLALPSRELNGPMIRNVVHDLLNHPIQFPIRDDVTVRRAAANFDLRDGRFDPLTRPAVAE